MEDVAKEAAITTLITTVLGSTLTAIINALLPAASQLDVPQCAASVAIGAAIGFLAGSYRTRKHERAAADGKMAELQAEHNAEIKSEKTAHAEQLAAMRAAHDAELQAERERLEAEASSVEAAHAEQLSAMRAEFDSRLASLRAEYDASAKEAAASKAKAAKLDKIQRRLSVLSAPQKELVAKVLDEGTIHEPSFGCDAAYLRDLGVFVTGSMVGMLSGADYSVNPEFAAEIREHRSEWLGM